MYDYTTSLPAYKEAQHNINDKQQQVLEAIKKMGICSDHQIADYLGWQINRVTPRRGELLKNGWIEFNYVGKDFETNRTVNFWSPKKNLSD